MTFRLRTIETTADGRRIVRDNDIAKGQISVGRSAENDIHLPDLAVDPVHATIAQSIPGRLAVAATGSLGFGLDGKSVQSAEIDAKSGAELRFGSYRVAIALDADGTPLLTIEQAEGEAATDEKEGFSLAGLLPGKRTMAWGFALVVLALFLAFPVISNLMYKPAPVSAAGPMTAAKQAAFTGGPTVLGDSSWSTGKLSLAHHSLENKCEVCHVKPFEAVKDETCATCHKDTHDHAPADRIAGSRAEPGMGGKFLWEVAHTFGKPGPGACTDCHTEHEGAGRMEPTRQQFCADCHGSLNERLVDTKLGNAGDFGTSHPQFRPAVALTMGSKQLTRVSLDDKPREASGLAFPHKMHLDTQGGVARMAASIGNSGGAGSPAYGTGGLQCKDCHQKTADGVRFLPIDMERDCGACHSLAYDKVGNTVRKLRHGEVDQMIADLTAARGGSEPIINGRRRPGDYAAGQTYFASFSAPSSGAAIASRALSRDGICGECHTPAFSGGGRFAVMPVTQVSRFMNHGWFDHNEHRQEKCSTCHKAETSTTSADLLLPDLKSCRTCHLGEGAVRAEVPSSCAMCHSYHVTAQAPKNVKPKNKSGRI